MNKIKTLLLTTLTAVACVGGLAACSSTKKSDTITVGVTDYAPMDYLEDNKWVGFDADLATKVFESLGYKVEFQEIDWDTKTVALAAGTIDCIWNGMTITDELKENILLSDVYLKNQQYGVVKVENASNYKSTADLAGKNVACEGGSAAESALEDLNSDALKDNKCKINTPGNQLAALMEVAAGTSDIAVVDYTIATAKTAAGTSYYNVLKAVDLGFEAEEFAIGFRKSDTELCSKVNAKIKEYKADGSVKTLAEKYGVENLLVD